MFISLNGYRDDDFRTYLFKSSDYGKTWTNVKGNLPESVANVIIQDPSNPKLLYCGLDNGTYVSLDNGVTWTPFNNMLNVASYDMMVHPRDNELVVATHGRSMFVADVKPLQSLASAGTGRGVMAFEPEAIRFNDRWGEKQYPWTKSFEPKVDVLYFIGKSGGTVSAEVIDDKNNVVKKTDAR